MEPPATKRLAREDRSFKAILMKEVFGTLHRQEQTDLILDFMKMAHTDSCYRVGESHIRDRIEGETDEQYILYSQRHRFEDWFYSHWILIYKVVTTNHINACYNIVRKVVRLSAGMEILRIGEGYYIGRLFKMFDGTNLFSPTLNEISKFDYVFGNNDHDGFLRDRNNTYIVCYDRSGARGVSKMRLAYLFDLIHEGCDIEWLTTLFYFLGYYELSDIDPDMLESIQLKINYALYRSETAPKGEKNGDKFPYYNVKGNPSMGTKWELLEARFHGLKAGSISEFRKLFDRDPAVLDV